MKGRGSRVQVFAVYRGAEIVGGHRAREAAERQALSVAETGLEAAVAPMWLDAPLAKAFLSDFGLPQ